MNFIDKSSATTSEICIIEWRHRLAFFLPQAMYSNVGRSSVSISEQYAFHLEIHRLQQTIHVWSNEDKTFNHFFMSVASAWLMNAKFSEQEVGMFWVARGYAFRNLWFKHRGMKLEIWWYTSPANYQWQHVWLSFAQVHKASTAKGWDFGFTVTHANRGTKVQSHSIRYCHDEFLFARTAD